MVSLHAEAWQRSRWPLNTLYTRSRCGDNSAKQENVQDGRNINFRNAHPAGQALKQKSHRDARSWHARLATLMVAVRNNPASRLPWYCQPRLAALDELVAFSRFGITILHSHISAACVRYVNPGE